MRMLCGVDHRLDTTSFFEIESGIIVGRFDKCGDKARGAINRKKPLGFDDIFDIAGDVAE